MRHVAGRSASRDSRGRAARVARDPWSVRRAGVLTISADLFLKESPSQRTLIEVTTSSGQFTSSLSGSAPRWIEPESPSSLASFAAFVKQGMWHVWIGYDHLAFLLLLLLPSVRCNSTFASVPRAAEDRHGIHGCALDYAGACRHRHRATAGPADRDGDRRLDRRRRGFEYVTCRLAVAAAAGVRLRIGPRLRLCQRACRDRFDGARLVPVLAGFNVGVELAQLSVVAIALPVLLRMRHSPFYAARLMPAASMAMMLAGAAWFAARA